MSKELRRCPFCGGAAVQRFSIWGESYAYGCYTTGCMGNVHNYTSGFKTDEEAIEAWNRRKPIEDIVEQLDRAKDEFSGGTLQEHYYWKGIEDAIEIVKGGQNE